MPWSGRLTALRPGPIDVHAHLLPRQCYRIPVGDSEVELAERDGQLHLGGVPIAVSGVELSSVPRLLADMDAHDVAVRVVSAPPYAFAIQAGAEAAAEYARLLNDSLLEDLAGHPDRLVPFGVVPVQDAAATAAEIRRLTAEGVVGISVPPVFGDGALGDTDQRHVLQAADAAGLAVLVHPMQQPRPGFVAHYLQNLIGNPVESACAIASITLGGLFDTMPDLRVAFVHGAGAAPALLGRWDHGWSERSDVSADTERPPSEIYRDHVYAETLTHSDDAAVLLQSVTAPERILLGSDYPFDMADPDPVGSARRRDWDTQVLRANALRWLGADPA
jgi:aminocarboxymuconate-semialdehyde decarboxylase